MNKLNVLSVLVVVMIGALCLTSPLQAAWVGNDGGGGGKSGSRAEEFIIQGASYYLQSYSDFLLLLNESETGLIKGFDLTRAQQVIESGLDKLRVSEENYLLALAIIKKTVFDEAWLKALSAFDYERLAAERHLYPQVINQVAAFLTKGDVAGLYQQMADNLEGMITNLQALKEKAQEGILPGMEALRTLYRQYSDFMTSGYYASLVFSTVKSL